MRVPCIPLHEISMFGIMFISVFCSIGAIRLYLFDSPAALKNIFHDEASLVDGLRAMYSNKQNYLNFLDRNFNHKARRSYGQITYAYFSSHKKRLENYYELYEKYHKTKMPPVIKQNFCCTVFTSKHKHSKILQKCNIYLLPRHFSL